MHIDHALQQLLPQLQNITEPTLWYADEHASTVISLISANPLLTIVSNRFDVYQQALEKKHHVIFSDFNSDDYQHEKPKHVFLKIIYRISKEKSLVNHIINQAAQLLANNGYLLISGYKQEGIKSYADNMKKIIDAKGKLVKSGNTYSGVFQFKNPDKKLDDKLYCDLQKITTPRLKQGYFYSKPGVFGWDKVDKGTELLLSCANILFHQKDNHSQTLLDLGCGYGWIILNCDAYGFASMTATDNNAAALRCIEANAQQLSTPVNIVASDCANTIDEKFDVILCNPAFHQGFKHSQSLTEKFIVACRQKIKKEGIALLVVNEFINIRSLCEKNHLTENLVAQENGFKVLKLTHCY